MKKKKTNDRYKQIIIILCVCIAVCVFGTFATLAYFKTMPADSQTMTNDETQESTSSSTQKTTLQTSSETQTQTTLYASNAVAGSETTDITKITEESKTNISESGRIIVDPTKEEWNLIVVNSSREIPEGYEPQLKEILGCGKYLDYRVAPYYEQMYYAAKEDGITLTPYSAYRTYERQKTNYENLTNEYMTRYNISKSEAAKKAATVILPPGTSEHNLGLAMDICNTYDSFANTKEYAWLTEHAHEYGFILRYTAEKQSITGIVPEPWHWRFVGVEYAKEIRDSGLCLEEWLDSKNIAY